jgi:hypothetical protein
MPEWDFLRNAPPELYYMIGAGGALLVLAILFLLVRAIWVRFAPAASEEAANGLDSQEAYLREHSMLPHSPETASGDSDPFVEGSTRERRSAPRRKGNPVDVLLSDAAAEVDPVTGVVLDRSATGLALELWVEGDVAPGTIISVRPKRPTADATWTRVIVRRCERKRTTWVLGCEFVRPPGVNTLMEFG